MTTNGAPNDLLSKYCTIIRCFWDYAQEYLEHCYKPFCQLKVTALAIFSMFRWLVRYKGWVWSHGLLKATRDVPCSRPLMIATKKSIKRTRRLIVQSGNFNPLTIIVFIPFLNYVIYPLLRRFHIRFGRIRRMTFGFTLVAIVSCVSTFSSKGTGLMVLRTGWLVPVCYALHKAEALY